MNTIVDKINEKSLKRLGWTFQHLNLESCYGKQTLLDIKPFKRGKEILLREEFDYLRNICSKFTEKTNLFSDFNRIFMELRNISGSIKNLQNGQILDETELFEIKNFSILISNILELAKEESILSDKLKNIDLKPIINILNPDKIVTRSFYIHESWSDKLKEIRDDKKNIENKIIACKDMEEKEKLREKRGEIVNKEREEELFVREQLTTKLKNYEQALEFITKNIGYFELALAKSELAIRYKCTIPEIFDSNSNQNICIENAYEPEISEILKNNHREFTPISIDLQKGVTLLTGANMGGKSVALRTIALNAELARYGFMVFAKKISMKIPDFIEVISGDMQNTNQGLSSFGAEIINLTCLLKKLDVSSGIAICDEFGRSTNPYEGSRFVQALGDILQSSTSYGIIATHYDGIKTKGAIFYQVAGLKALFDKDFDNTKLSGTDLYKLMDYHLIKVSDTAIVPHEALNISKLLGLPEKFLESLKKYYN